MFGPSQWGSEQSKRGAGEKNLPTEKAMSTMKGIGDLNSAKEPDCSVSTVLGSRKRSTMHEINSGQLEVHNVSTPLSLRSSS